MIWQPQHYPKSFLVVCVLVGFATFTVAQDHAYDAAGRLVWSSQPSGASTSITYDPAGNILAIASVSAGTDSDGDGVPDRYEVKFTGSPTALHGAADPFGRGVTNSVAYAFGAPPFASTGSFIRPLDVIVDSISGDTILRLQYRRPKDGPLLWTYHPEISTGLNDWGSNDVFEADATDEGGGLELVTLHARVPTTGGSVFARIRLTRVAP